MKNAILWIAFSALIISVVGCSHSPKSVLMKNMEAFNERNVEKYIDTLDPDYLTTDLNQDTRQNFFGKVFDSIQQNNQYMCIIDTRILSETSDEIKILCYFQTITENIVEDKTAVVVLRKGKNGWRLFTDCNLSLIKDQKVAQDIEAIMNDLRRFAQTAYKYRITPRGMAGGGGSYEKIKLPDIMKGIEVNPDTSFSIIAAEKDILVIEAIGKNGQIPWIVRTTIDHAGQGSISVIQQASWK